ncbi:protein kinase domain-containing protein [Streptomyces sp. NPDC001515]
MEKLGSADPQRIGGYRLLGRLGAGGMGQVYLARSDRGRVVALKLVREELAEKQEFRERFRQEVGAARRVGSAWTAPVLDADTEAAVPWVATGYIAGPSLQTTVSGRTLLSAGPAPGAYGPLPDRSVHILGTGLAHALRAIHAAGLIHRDLKPSNILLTIDGPRVIDFGIARALDTVTDGGLTRTGALVGSPGFMAPEQVRGERVTTACDVFCLGSVLAYASTGRLPFGTAATGVPAQLFRIAQEEPDLTGVPVDLVELVRDCLHKDPPARPTTDEILERLDGGDGAEPWLPAALIAQLGRQAVGLLDTEDPQDTDPESGPSTAVLRVTAPADPPPPPVPDTPHPSPDPSASVAPQDTAPTTPVPPAARAGAAYPPSPYAGAAAPGTPLPGGTPPGSTPPGNTAPGTPAFGDPHAAPATPAYGYPQRAPGTPAYGYPHQSPAQPGYGPQPAQQHQGYAYAYPQQPGFGTAPPHGPGDGRPERGERRSTGSTVALIVIAVLVAVGAGGSVYALMNDRGAKPEASPSRSAGPAPTDETAGSPSPSPGDDGDDAKGGAPDAGDVPDGYLGTWTAGLDNASGHSTRTLVIGQGAVGETVLTLTAEGPLDTGGTYHCVFSAGLAARPSAGSPVSIGPSTVTEGEPMTSCTPGGATTLTLLPDGSLSRVNTDTGDRLTYTKSG